MYNIYYYYLLVLFLWCIIVIASDKSLYISLVTKCFFKIIVIALIILREDHLALTLGS